MKPHLNPDTVQCMTPRGGLQAAEYEDRGYGYLNILRNSVCYIDSATGDCLTSFSYPSHRDAELQLSFFRQACQDAKRRRSSDLVQPGAEFSEQRPAMSEPKNEKPAPEMNKAESVFFQFAHALFTGAVSADSLQGQAPLAPKPWQILDISFPRPIVRMTFFSERRARATCETMNAKARRERFKVAWMGA
ncbi:hypothetical protein [Methylobacterium nodulans]|nr:hypothetical protein [Methylobacterium nodulans]